MFDATLSLQRRELEPKLLRRLLVRYPAASLAVVARIYLQALRLKLKGVRHYPHPERSRMNPTRAIVSAALRRIRGGRIEVVEDGRRAAFGPADARLRATVRIHDQAAWGRLRQRLGRPRRGLHGRRVGLRRPRLAGPDRGARDAAARPSAARDPAAAAAAGAGAAEHPRGRPAPHLRPLRPRQRALRQLPRRDDDLLLRRLRLPADVAARGPAGEARAGLPQARARPNPTTCSRSAPAGAASRSTPPSGTAAGSPPRRSPASSASSPSAASSRPGSRTGSRSCSRTTATCAGASTSWPRSR